VTTPALDEADFDAVDFRAMAESVPALVFVTDIAGSNLYTNASFQNFAGLAADALIGSGWLTVLHPDDRARAAEIWSQAVASEEPYEADYRFRAADGEYRWHLCRARPSRKESRITHWVGTCTDIEDRRESQQLLLESEKRFRTLTDAIPALVFVADAAGNNIYTNPQFHEYSGMSGDALTGSGWLNVFDPAIRARVADAWAKTLQNARPYEVQSRLRRADGVLRTFIVRANPLPGADGNVIQWVGTGMDIQQTVDDREALAESRRALEAINSELETRVAKRAAELTRANRGLQTEIKRREAMQATMHQSQKLEALGQLTSGIAHDFNNILAAITSGYALIEQRTDDAETRLIAEHCKAAAFRGAKLVKQMLAFARQEVLAPQLVSISRLADEIEPLIRQAIPGTIVKIDIAPNLPDVLIDPVLLETALLNLAVNARDAMPDGGSVVITARLAPADMRGRPAQLSGLDAVAICLRDTGEGMAPDVLQRVIEPFFTTKAPGKGTGLGLAMVHGFVEQSGGAMHIESVVGRGTAVTLYLPCTSKEMETPQDAEPAFDLSAPAQGAILLVDDDVDVCAITAIQLRAFGYSVTEANDLPSAMAAITQGIAFDYVLSDVVMPGGDGIALAKLIRSQRRDVPILFMTGRADSDRVTGEIVLQKPFTPTTLAGMLTNLADTEARERDTRAKIATRIRSDSLKDMLSQWERVKIAGLVPEFDLFDIELCSVREQLAVIEVDAAHVPMRFFYSHVGNDLEQALGQPLAGRELEVRGIDQFGTVEDSYRRCFKSRQPVYEYAKAKLGDGVTELFERIILPYSCGGQLVDRLVSVVVLGKSDA
jgi:PAS domain S-box-containing protein